MKNLENIGVTEMELQEMSCTNGGGDLVDAVNYVLGFWASSIYHNTQAFYAGGGQYR